MLNNKLVCTLVLLVSLLTACNGTTGSGSQKTPMQNNGQPANPTSVPTAEVKNPPPAAGNAVRVARWSRNPAGGSMVAALEGTLGVANNCLVKSGNYYDPPMLLVFPYGSGVWDDAKRSFTYKGKVMVVGIGEFIEVGGGTPPNLDHLKQFGKYDVPDCGINNFFQVF